jgi:dienelactone hydrolase
VGRRLCIAGALAAVLAGCGGGSRPQATATATPASGSAPRAIESCAKAARGWRTLAVRAHGEALDAATLGTGHVGVAFANQSGNNPCDWLPFASELARGGRRVAVFAYADAGSADIELLAVARALRTTGARSVALVGASLGGRAVVEAAAKTSGTVAAAISLSAERSVGRLPEILPVARRVHVPSLYIGSREDGYTTFGRETRQFHRVTPARVNRMLLVPGADHGVDLLTDANGPRVRAAIADFVDAGSGH